MKPYEFVGWTLINTTAVSAIVGTTSAASVWHGLRPKTTDVPSINYYELPGTRKYGMETATFSINCRAATAAGARDLADAVINVFHGTAGNGIYGTANGFDVARSSLRADQGLIPEPEDQIFNAPVDVLLVYASDTVS